MDYDLLRQTRRTLAIRVGRDGRVEVRAPRHLSRVEIDHFLYQRQDWIRQQQARQRERAARPGWRDGRLWWHQGRPLRIGLAPDETDVRCLADEIRLPLPLQATEDDIFATLQQWQLAQARDLLPGRLRQQAANRGVTRLPTQITVRAMRSRWGSCSVRGRISLSSQLLHLPDALADYVICHELAHLREMNHGPAFWAELESLYPGAKKAQASVAHWARLLQSA